jgi:LCP family protein required for cell wall assembly
MKTEEDAPKQASLEPLEPAGAFRPPLDDPPVNVYRARRQRKPWTAWRIVRWTLFVVLLAALSIGGYVAVHVYNNYKRIVSDSAATKGADKVLDQPEQSQAGASVPPATILVLGYDHRAADGNAPSRSDTLMLVHVDPKGKWLTMLSLPRDLGVEIPGYGLNKLNAAYSFGGAPLAIETIKHLLGVHINYIVALNFRGFVQTVDAFHGVYLDVDQRYFHVSGLGGEAWSSVNLLPGYRLLNGAQALSYARYRHTDSDIYRLARQQAFVREFKRRVGVLSSVQNVLHLTDIMGENVRVRGATGHTPGLNTLANYARLLTSIPRSRILQLRIVGDQGAGGSIYVQSSQGELQTAVDQFLHPDMSAASQVANRVIGGKVLGGHAAHKAPPPIPAAKLRVLTLNGSGVDLAATTAAAQLRSAGWKLAAVGKSKVTGQGNMPGGERVYSSAVYYATPRAESAARRLQIALGDATAPAPLPADLSILGQRADVVVGIGKAWSGSITAPTQTQSSQVPAAQTPEVSPLPASDVALFRARQAKLGYPILYPRKIPSLTEIGEPIQQFDPLFVYSLHGDPAMHMTAHRTYSSSPQYVWGMQWTPWTTAPILDTPSVPPRVVAGRTWRLYFNGGHLHRIAVFWKPPHARREQVVWITNSLSDEYSNETMKAVAASLAPVPRR